MKPKKRQPVPLSLFYLRSAPVRDLGLRASVGRRLRPFFVHTLVLRSQRSPLAQAQARSPRYPAPVPVPFHARETTPLP